MVEVTGELDWDLGPEEVTGLLRSHNKTWTDEEGFFLWMSKESVFLRWSLLLVKIVEMTIQELKYYINLLDKAMTGSERIDTNFEESSTVSKMLSDNIVCYK